MRFLATPLLIAAALFFAPAAPALHAGETLKEILDRMDADAVQFKGVTARLKRIEYIASIKDLSEEQATMTLVRTPKGIGALLDYAAPDKKAILFADNKVQEFLPKINTIRVTDLGKFSSVVSQFVQLGFGSSGKELSKNYIIQLAGPDSLKHPDGEIKTTRLELVPRSAEALKYMKRIEFWVPEGKSYAVQLKIHQPSGDTNTAIYSGVLINPPGLSEKALDLKAPKNAKREQINK